MWCVYILRSKKQRGKTYIGSTNNLQRRLQEHNQGVSKSTKPFLPWEIEAVIYVKSESIARSLEKYFKTGSGKAILKKRILSAGASA